jgi:SWIM zinc finger
MSLKENLIKLGLKEYQSHLPPGILPNLNGKRYAIVHPNNKVKYIEIPIEITIEDLLSLHSRKETIKKEQTYIVPSNTSMKDYIVKFSNGLYSCTCKGFDFKPICSHIELVKTGNLEEYKANFKRIEISTGKGFKIVTYNKYFDEYVCTCASFIKKGTCIHITKAKE